MPRKPCDECGSTNHSNHDMHLVYKTRWRHKNRKREQIRKKAKGYDLKDRYPNLVIKHISMDEWVKLLTGMCFYCYNGAESIDHVVPVGRGGQHSIGNIVGACLPCNQSKGSRTIMEWRMSESQIGTRAWRKTRDAILMRDGYECHYCGGTATTADHVVPRSKGGTNDESNLVAACQRCNSSKGDRVLPRKRFFEGERTRPPAGAIYSPMRKLGPPEAGLDRE